MNYGKKQLIMEKMKSNGLTYCPKRDGPESRMFVIGDLNGILTQIIHLVKYNGDEWNNKINFRDYMNNNIEKAKEYEKVKIKSMENNENNVQNYHKNKELFVLESIKEANNWKKDHKKINLGFMVSHGGSNMQAVLEAISKGKLNANPCVLISNNSNSQAIEKAKYYGFPYYHISQKIYPDIDELDEIILNTLKKHSVEYLLLLGYMKKLGKKTLQEYTGRILNIHPALLPKYGGVGMYGKYVHEAVLKNKEKITGITIHLVDNDYDTGKIINKCTVNVLENDSIESLSQRVLKKEHEFLVETLVKISNNEIIL